jgi:hypothetical protein
MYGPIVVGTLGPNKTQQQRGSLAGSFASPFLGYFPTTRGLPGFEVHANRRAFVYTTLHPAGFYPGDPAGGRWASALQNRPESTPVLRESSLGSLNALQTSQFAQAYAIVDNLFRPLQGASVNARVLGQRNELRASLFEQSERFKVPNGTAVLEQELFRTWTSVDSQLNVGLQRASGAGRGPAGSASAHGQFEAGMWFYVTHNTLACGARPNRRSGGSSTARVRAIRRRSRASSPTSDAGSASRCGPSRCCPNGTTGPRACTSGCPRKAGGRPAILPTGFS